MFMDRDAEPVESPPQVTPGLRVQPAAHRTGSGDTDLKPRAGLGDFGSGLDRGEVAAHHQHRSGRTKLIQTPAQPQRRRPRSDVEAMLAHARHTMLGDSAAQGVQQSVVLQPLPAGVDGDAAVLDVDGGDARLPHSDSGPGEKLPPRVAAQFLTGGELVQPGSLDEVRFGGDDGDLHIVRVQPPGQLPGGVGSGVPGSEDDDPVAHGRAPVCSRDP